MEDLSKFDIDVIELPTPWTAGPTNSYVLKRDEIIIIDTGIKDSENLSRFLKYCKATGIDKKRTRILITHGHTDHYGFSESLSQMLNSKIFVPEKEIPKTTVDFFRRMKEKIESKKDFFTSSGIPEELLSILPFIPEQNEMLRESITHPAVMPWRIELGETIEVIPLPGHTSGHVGFFLTECKILFTGDHILPQLVFNPLYDITQDNEFNFNTLKDYEKSLFTILNLKPHLIAPGHRKVIRNVEGIIRRRINYIRNLKMKIAETVLNSHNPLSPFEIAEKLNPSVEKWQILFIFPVILCILKELEEKKEIISIKEGNVIRYAKH